VKSRAWPPCAIGTAFGLEESPGEALQVQCCGVGDSELRRRPRPTDVAGGSTQRSWGGLSLALLDARPLIERLRGDVDFAEGARRYEREIVV